MFYVAEVGSNHKGSKALAFEFIRQFSQAGADVIKFQFGWTRQAQERYTTYNAIRYIDEWAPELMEWGNLFNVQILASIWSEEGLAVAAAAGMNELKISAQVWKNDQPLAQKILRWGARTYVSMSEYQPTSGLPIYAVSQYPTYPGEIHMPSVFLNFYGYSDHSHGIGACLLAIARGAQYIEKHVCLDRELVTRDAAFAATPDDFGTLVYAGEEMRRYM
jgi:N,N'-diacetyllegionaminate synthase